MLLQITYDRHHIFKLIITIDKTSDLELGLSWLWTSPSSVCPRSVLHLNAAHIIFTHTTRQRITTADKIIIIKQVTVHMDVSKCITVYAV